MAANYILLNHRICGYYIPDFHRIFLLETHRKYRNNEKPKREIANRGRY